MARLVRAALEVEAGAVDERAVARRERRHRPPVAGDRHRLPGVVVVLGLDRLAAEVVVGECGAPGAGQVHTRRERRSSRPARRRGRRPAGRRVGSEPAEEVLARAAVGCPHVLAPRHPRSAPRVRLAVAPGQGGDPAQRRRQDRRRRAPVRPACSATRPPSCRSWRTPSSPGTTSSSWASGARPRPASSARSTEPARRVDARSSPAPRSTTTPTSRCPSHARDLVARPRRRHADRLGPPRRPLRREAGHPRHVHRRPHRRGRPHQGGRGPLPVRRAHAPLRPRPPHQPRHLRHQRAARPGRAHPGRPAQRARGARRPGAGLQDPPAARRAAGRLGQPRRLHEPRPHHHPAEGPLRQPDPHPLPARGGDRGRHHAPGGPAGLGRRRARHDARLHGRRRGRVLPPGPPEQPREPALGCVRAPQRVEQRGAGGQRRAPGPALGRARGRAPHLRPRGAGRVDRRQDRDREPRGGPRGPDHREHAQGCGADRVQAAAVARQAPRGASPRSTRAWWPTPARTSPRSSEAELVGEVPALREPVAALTRGDESPAAVASAIEFVLEGLHLSKRLNKESVGARATFRGRS